MHRAICSHLLIYAGWLMVSLAMVGTLTALMGRSLARLYKAAMLNQQHPTLVQTLFYCFRYQTQLTSAQAAVSTYAVTCIQSKPCNNVVVSVMLMGCSINKF